MEPSGPLPNPKLSSNLAVLLRNLCPLIGKDACVSPTSSQAEGRETGGDETTLWIESPGQGSWEKTLVECGKQGSSPLHIR